jgi:type I restriction enzyme, S subunit
VTAWTSVRLSSVLRDIDDREHPDLEVLSVYRDLGVIPKASRDDNFNKTPEDLSSYKRVRVGDLVINKMKAWSGSLAVSDYDGIVSGDYMVCAVKGSVDRRFLHHLLRSSTHSRKSA